MTDAPIQPDETPGDPWIPMDAQWGRSRRLLEVEGSCSDHDHDDHHSSVTLEVDYEMTGGGNFRLQLSKGAGDMGFNFSGTSATEVSAYSPDGATYTVPKIGHAKVKWEPISGGTRQTLWIGGTLMGSADRTAGSNWDAWRADRVFLVWGANTGNEIYFDNMSVTVA